MKKIINSVLIGLAFVSMGGRPLNAAQDCAEYLEHRISQRDKRYQSFALVLNLLEKREAKTLVETGTARGGERNFIGDGGSTIIFGHWASKNHAHLFSVDINPRAVDIARQVTLPYVPHVDVVESDSIAYLNSFNIPIDFLYLDSFDFQWGNPLPSQEHHLKEIKAAYPCLHENSIVMIDDCKLPQGGKGGLVTKYLLERGWHIHFDGYQRIFLKTPASES